MATQVETLLPGNPLAKAEEHGKVIHGEPEEEEGGRGDGAKRQTGVADQGSSSGGSSLGQGGTPGTENQTSKQATEEEGKGDCDSEDKQNEETVKSCDKKEFTEAPPPKVNPWTRKMNAVTVVSVNGQAHHGLYPPYVLIYWLSVLCWCLSAQVCSHETTPAAIAGFRYHLFNQKEPSERINKPSPVVALLLLPYKLVIFGVPPPRLFLEFRVAEWTHGWLISQGITPLHEVKMLENDSP